MALRRLSAPAPQTYKPHVVPASTGGINAVDSLISMPPEDCLYCYNIVPSEFGLRLRKGYREWATNIDGSVNSVIPFEAQAEAVANDKLFCVTPNGIYDITLENTDNPTAEVVFTDNSDAAGFGVFTEFTTDAGDGVLFYADSRNGLHMYDEGTGLWTVPAVTGVDPTKVAFIMAWKNRLWMIENDSSQAWYLDPDSIAGAATKFTFGSKFIHGGNLMGLWSWTIDGGAGVDDYLVALSRGGDVLVYQGTDPTTIDTFSLVGSWYIGEVPESRRVAIEWGGDLYLLSVFGITSIRDLLQGVQAEALASPARKVARPIRTAVQDKKDSPAWSMTINPSDGFLQVIVPYEEQNAAVQYVQNLGTKAWGAWSTVPMQCAQDWNAYYYFGSKDGRVWIYDGTLDGTLLDGTVGQPIEFNILTAFQAPEGDHTTHKRVSFIRPVGVVAGSTSISVKAIYDYQVEQSAPVAPQAPTVLGTTWDFGTWDDDVWDFSLLGASITLGASGIGRVFAISTRGSSSSRINILAWDCTFTGGGFL